MEKILRFLRSNLINLIWCVFYFIIAWAVLGANTRAFIITFVAYSVSITIALCPLGEILLRLIEGMRKVATREEKEYLLPLFEEVYEQAKEHYPKLNKNIQLYIDDSGIVNAYAIGRKTVTVTRGALETFTADELKGVLAHELGHHANGDTKGMLLTVIGNGIFSILILIANIIIKLITFTTILLDSGVYYIIARLFTFVINIYLFAFMFIGQLAMAHGSRQAEYYADRFAHEIQLGDELIEALYVIQKIEMSAKVPFFERLKASHPYTAKRIEQLEKLQDLEYEEMELLEQ